MVQCSFIILQCLWTVCDISVLSSSIPHINLVNFPSTFTISWSSTRSCLPSCAASTFCLVTNTWLLVYVG